MGAGVIRADIFQYASCFIFTDQIVNRYLSTFEPTDFVPHLSRCHFGTNRIANAFLTLSLCYAGEVVSLLCCLSGVGLRLKFANANLRKATDFVSPVFQNGLDLTLFSGN